MHACRQISHKQKDHSLLTTYVQECNNMAVCHARLGTQLEYSVFFMPRRTMVCEKVFQEEGIFGDVTLKEYPLDFIPFDSDILSLELDTAYKVTAPQPNPSPHLLCSLQTLYQLVSLSA